MNSCRGHGFVFFCGGACAAADDRTGVAHAASRRRGLPGDQSDDRLFNILLDVDGGLLAQLIGMVLGPLRGTEKAGLLAIPKAKNNGSFRPPALAEQRSETAGLFEQRCRTGDRIGRSVDPSVMVVTANDRTTSGCELIY